MEYILHPEVQFDSSRALETARWVEATARRFGILNPAPITYYQLPDLQAAYRVVGLDWALTSDRVGGRANPGARMVLAADPRFAEANRHEIAHVLLAPLLEGASEFSAEGIAYWLGGARGHTFPAMIHDLDDFLDAHPTLTLRALLDDAQSVAAGSARLPAAAAVFELAHRRGGDTAVRGIVGLTRTGVPAVESLAAALGVSAAELEVQWRTLVASYAGAAATR